MLVAADSAIRACEVGATLRSAHADPVLLSNLTAAAGMTTDIMMIAARMKLEISILAGAFEATYSVCGQNEG